MNPLMMGTLTGLRSAMAFKATGLASKKVLPKGTMKEQLFIGYVISQLPRFGYAAKVVLPNLWGGQNPLFLTSPLTYLKPTAALGSLAAGQYLTMKPGATSSFGPYGSVRIVPKLGVF